MRNLLFIIAVILGIGWAVGYFGYHLGAVIHALLVIAVVITLLGIIRGKKIT